MHDQVGGLARPQRAPRAASGIEQTPLTRIKPKTISASCVFCFHAYYGEGHPDAAGLQAAIVARGGLEQLSRERVRMELMKLLVAPRAVPALTVMAEAGLIGMVLGGVPYLASFANVMKVETECELAPDATRRLGALASWIGEDAERLWQRLRLSNVERERLAAMTQAWWRVSPQIGEARARELIYRIGAEHFGDRALLAWSRAEEATAHDTAWRDLVGLCRSAGAFRRFSAARRGFPSRAGSRRGHRSAPRSRAPRKPGSRPAFRSSGKRSTTSSTTHSAGDYSAARIVIASLAPSCITAASSA